jgi:hypothetical protein
LGWDDGLTGTARAIAATDDPGRNGRSERAGQLLQKLQPFGLPLARAGGDAWLEAPDGQVRLDVRLERETIWLACEPGEEATTEEYSVVQSEGTRQVRRQLKHHNLDAVLSVGYRVNSKRGTQFRKLDRHGD